MSTCDSARLRISALTRSMSACVAASNRSSAPAPVACLVAAADEAAMKSSIEWHGGGSMMPAQPAILGVMSLEHPIDFVKQQTLTRDAFLGGRLNLSQPRNGFRAGLDSVLLGAAV